MSLKLYDTLTRDKKEFVPIKEGEVSLYLCGPTVYSDAHLGHARSAVSFDLLHRYLKYKGYKVNFVRNITDVGHLERDMDEGEDKLAKKAKLENLSVAELAEKYIRSYHRDLDNLNVLKPNIEPRASGHIIEQIELVKRIIDRGYAYESNGSVYFDVKKYSERDDNTYGKLSGRILEDLLSNTRELSGQSEKKYPLDFALWKKASPEHIMRWPSPWSDGFPGWHLECSAMSIQYLGSKFDIHAGGLDLCFPHHECEIAQNIIGFESSTANYWMHNNMVTVNEQKMSKSLNNFITIDQLFTGQHSLLDRGYKPMVLRFFILQAHYRSTVSFNVEGLKSAENSYLKLINAYKDINDASQSDQPSGDPLTLPDVDLNRIYEECIDSLDDDLNSSRLIANLFSLAKYINTVSHLNNSWDNMTHDSFQKLKEIYTLFIKDILGLTIDNDFHQDEALRLLLKIYSDAKVKKDFDLVDQIRASLKSMGIVVEDRKTGITYRLCEV